MSILTKLNDVIDAFGRIYNQLDDELDVEYSADKMQLFMEVHGILESLERIDTSLIWFIQNNYVKGE